MLKLIDTFRDKSYKIRINGEGEGRTTLNYALRKLFSDSFILKNFESDTILRPRN